MREEFLIRYRQMEEDGAIVTLQNVCAKRESPEQRCGRCVNRHAKQRKPATAHNHLFKKDEIHKEQGDATVRAQFAPQPYGAVPSVVPP